MTDLDRELSALGTLSVPDQWADIVARAAEPEPMLIEIGPSVARPGRRGLVAAAVLVTLVGLSLVVLGRLGDGGSDRGLVTAPSRAANEPALLDLDQPVQPQDERAVSEAFREGAAVTTVVVGQPSDDGYRHLIALVEPVVEGIASSGSDQTQWFFDDPVPGAALAVTDAGDGRTFVEGRFPLAGREVGLASIAPIEVARTLIRDLEQLPSEVGETFGPWEVVEIATAQGGASTMATVTTTIDGRPAQLLSNPATSGGPLGGFVLGADEVERVTLDGRVAWYGPRFPALTWALPGGGWAVLAVEGTPAELVAVAETVVERTPEEWTERGGSVPDAVAAETTDTTAFIDGNPLPTIDGPGAPQTRASSRVTAPQPEIDGWTTTAQTYRLTESGAPWVGWLLERDGLQVSLNAGPSDSTASPPEDWDDVELDRDGIVFSVDPEGRLSLWDEPGVGVVQMIVEREPDRSLQVELAEQLRFVDVEVPSIPLPEPQPRGDEQVALTATVDGRSVELQVDGDGVYNSMRFDGLGPYTFGVSARDGMPIAEIAAVDGTGVVVIHLPDTTGEISVSAVVEGRSEVFSPLIQTIGDRSVALFGIGPLANGQTGAIVSTADQRWTFDIPRLPDGWVDGVLAPAS